MRYTITFGRTVRPVNFESIRIECSQEFDDEETPSEKGYREVKGFVLKKIEEELEAYAKKEDTKVPETPDLISKSEPLFYSIPGLDELPWKSYKTRKACELGEEGWIFSNSPCAEELVNVISREGVAHVVIDGVKMVCWFSGPTDVTTRLPRFISRKKS